MALIEHTNIIIDDFSIAKRYNNRIYTHFLTHVHADHLKGLHDGWNYGPIYCTKPTQDLLLYRYPSLSCLNILELNKPTPIKMSDTLEVTVTFLDANHCVGSVMILIEGYMGRILYTGDIRFERDLFEQYTLLYPPNQLNYDFEGCSKHIDVLYLDNTFLKERFLFPPQIEVLEMAKQFIQHILDLNEHTRIYIGMDNIGKQQVLVAIAKHFNMYIVVDDKRYEQLRAMEGIDLQLFTTRGEEGVVQVIKKDSLIRTLEKEEGAIGLLLSGWVNKATYRFKGRIYCLPYSLHSNYKEIHQFVKSIKPSFLHPIVHQCPDENKFFYTNNSITKRDLIFNETIFQPAQGNYLKEIDLLRNLYCTPPTPQYSLLINDFELQKRIQKELLPPQMPEFGMEKSMVPLRHLQVVERKKYKLQNTRNQQQINRMRNMIEMKRKSAEGQQIWLIEDNDSNQRSGGSGKDKERDVIDIDEMIEVEKEILEVDASYSSTKRKRSNKRFKGQEEEVIEELLRDKIRKKQKANEIKLDSEPQVHQINKINRSTVNQCSEQKKVERPEEQPQPVVLKKSQKIVSLADINLEKIDEIQFLRRKNKIDQYLQKHPKDQSWILGSFQEEDSRQ